MDVPAPGVGAVCGPCPQGYRGDGSKCAGKLSLHVLIIKNSLWEFDCDSESSQKYRVRVR